MSNIFDFIDSFREIETIPVIPVQECNDVRLLFTFAIPTYCRSKTLNETIQSILKQNTDIEYNIIICDNNPIRNDETECLINDRYKGLKNLSYYKNSSNLYSHGNWNRLVTLCRTKYMILIHDDDVLFENFLSEITGVLHKFPNAAAINVGKIDWDGKEVKFASNNNHKYRVISNTVYLNFPFYIFQAPTGCLFDINALKKTGGFSRKVGPSFDYVNTFVMCMQNQQVLLYEKPLMLYRCVDNASSDMKVQYQQVDGDNMIRMQLGEYMNIPTWYVKLICWFKTKVRLRGINKHEEIKSYKGYTPAGIPFMILYRILSWMYMTVWKNGFYCVGRI